MLQKPEKVVTKVPGRASTQFSTVHALRGLAALWVVFFHARNYSGLYGERLGHTLISTFMLDYGRGGVAIFFVLSGFVISHSLWQSRMPARSVGLFMLRRSIRLDIPYWSSIILAIVLTLVQSTRHGYPLSLEPQYIIAHMFYLQELFRIPEILVVYWTLTYEVQFYLVYALMLCWFYLFYRKTHVVVAIVPGILLLIAAFYGAAQHSEWVLHGLFLNYWYAFVAGVLAYAGGHRRIDICFALCILLSLTMMLSAPFTSEIFNTPAALTAIGLAALARVDKLAGLSGAAFKSLGTISYSLYLVHVPAIVVAVSVATRVFQPTLPGAIATFTCSVAAALLLGALFWWSIERPSHRLARRIRSE